VSKSCQLGRHRILTEKKPRDPYSVQHKLLILDKALDFPPWHEQDKDQRWHLVSHHVRFVCLASRITRSQIPETACISSQFRGIKRYANGCTLVQVLQRIHHVHKSHYSSGHHKLSECRSAQLTLPLASLVPADSS